MHFAIPVLLTAALAAAADSDYVVHERRTPEQSALLRRLDRVSPDTVLPVRIALKQQHDLTNVSHPSSADHGKRLSEPGNTAVSPPPTQQQQIVLDWLKQQGPGIDEQALRDALKRLPPRAETPPPSTTTVPEWHSWDRTTLPTIELSQSETDAQALRDAINTLPSPDPTILPNGEIAADILAVLAELIFETEYFEYEGPDGTILIGNDEYSLPEDISTLVNFVVPGIMLAALFEELDEIVYDVVMVDSDPGSTGELSQ